MDIDLSTPLSDTGVQNRFILKLKRLGIETAGDLLMHFPSRYEDWSATSPIAELKIGDEKTISGKIQSVRQVRTPRRRMLVTEIMVADESGSIRAVWFNQPYVTKSLKNGAMVKIAGKVAGDKKGIFISNPTHEIDYGGDTKHTGRIVAVYPETKGLTSRGIRFLVQPILQNIKPVSEFIPNEILEKLNLPGINEALRAAHIPQSMEEANAAKRRFAFQDLFLLRLKNELERLALKRETAEAISLNRDELKGILADLPFRLTDAQSKAMDEILEDMAKPHPMNRLLQGDVGSGKTIVAGVAALVSAHEPNNLQTAFMAPTEILARQHYKTLTGIFSGFTGGIGLLVAKEARVFYGEGLEDKITKSALLKNVADGKIKIVVGTHTLISARGGQKGINFNNLGLVIVDEQHRFGVKQRALLVDRGQSQTGTQTNADRGQRELAALPHFLSMSATPIPRTLMMTAFGNLDISLISELPKGRKTIITKIVDPINREKAYAFIRGEVRKGRQVYVVCPKIEPTTDDLQPTTGLSYHVDEIKAVKDEYERLSKKVFPDLKVAMLHGKLKSQEKDDVMKKFAGGDSDLLVSTSVIEVGVDVPNATIMMIENAERFGLAQLYQFRGRVGRGDKQSFCFLFTESHTADAHRRLESLITAKSSFELAEMDLAIRGPGEFLGESQSGMPDIAMKAVQNPKLLKDADESAKSILKDNPELDGLAELKKQLDVFGERIHLE